MSDDILFACWQYEVMILKHKLNEMVDGIGLNYIFGSCSVTINDT